MAGVWQKGMMTFWSYIFVCILIVTIGNAARLHLSAVGSDNNETNNCEQGYNPCGTWDHASSLLNSYYNRLYISSGFYDAHNQIRLSNDSNIKIFGEYAPDTVIYYNNIYGTLFYSDNEHDISLYLTNITYSPKYGASQRLVYLYYGDSFEMNDIIINGNNSNNSNYFYDSSYDMVYCYEVDDIVVQNVTIVDMINSDSYLFELQYADSITFNNILVTMTNNNSNSIRFGWFDDTDGDIYLSNIVITNYSTLSLFYFRDNNYVNTHLTNIMLDNVSGGTFFRFLSQYYDNITMENIIVDGNGNILTNNFLCYSRNYYGSLTIKDSSFRNFIFSSSAIGFNFDSLYYTAEIRIFNVTFSNLVARSSNYGYSYGIIYVDDEFFINIDNCTFENNTNFISLIYCDSYSYCNINIKNSHFANNDGFCLGERKLINGIFLGSNANGYVTIRNTVFVGYPYIKYDSTSSFFMDNDTYSTVGDVNDTKGCKQDQTVFVSQDRYASFLLCFDNLK